MVLQEKNSEVLVDVREAEELLDKSHPNALHAPYSMIIQNQIPQHLPQDKRLLLFCRSGKRAKHAEAILREKGFDVVAISQSIDELL